MQYIRGLEHYDNARKTAVTFGKFDGLHKGHMTLVDTVKKLQDKDDVDSVVCAFDMDSPALLMLPQERQIHHCHHQSHFQTYSLCNQALLSSF